MTANHAARAAGTLAALTALAGCTLAPKGTSEEKDRVSEAGKPYAPRFEDRALPELPDNPDWRDVLHRAFLANGNLESAYFDWKSSVEQIDIVSAYPNTNLALGFSYTFSSERMKAFDRMTFSAGPDAMLNLSFPTKVSQRGKVALDEAQAAGERFRAAKFDLQRRVLTAWADYALTAERVRILREQADLARSVADTAKGRVIAGGAQADLLRADLALRTSEDRALNGEAELAAARATLNGMLARDANAPINPPKRPPEPRLVAADDAALFAAAVDQNPELAGLARQVEGRTDALELARLQWIPDINPTVAFTGSVSQALGAVVVLPTTVVQIRGGINQAEAMLRGTEAALRQTKRDRAAEFVATLFMLRNAERQAALFGGQIVPAAERFVTASQQQYSAGAATYLDLIESERALLDARLVVAEARAMREKRLAELEALMGADVETIGAPAQPSINPDRVPDRKDGRAKETPMNSQSTPSTLAPAGARRSRAWIVIVVLSAATAGIYAGTRWHSSIAPLLGMKAAEGARGGEQASQGAGSKQLWTCGMHPQVIQDHPGDCPICHMKLTPLKMGGMTADGADADRNANSVTTAAASLQAPGARQADQGRKVKYWWDPMMNPPYISDKPGKSPMGMDLVPAYEEEAQLSAGQVIIDPAVVQNMGVRTAAVTEGPLERSVRVVGYFDEAEPNIRDINLRVSGWVRRLYTNTEGQHVEAGDPLFDLYSPELQVAIEELISARRAMSAVPTGDAGGSPGTAATLKDAATRKLQLLGVDPRQIEALAKLDKAPETVTFASPITGYLTEKPIVEGAAVQAGQRALRIVDQSVLWLEGQVFEKDMPLVKVGQEATARIAAGPGAPGDTVKGEVIFVRPRLDAMTRTTTVRLAIPNPSLALRPGMYATVRLESRLAERTVLVPREAVIDTGERQVVFVAGPAGHFEPREVTMGLPADRGTVQIVRGLSPGETVVTSGQFLLDSESRLREAIQKFLREKTRATTASPDTAPASTAPSPMSPPAGAPRVDAVVAAYLDLSEVLGAVQKNPSPVDLSPLITAARALHGDLHGAKDETLVAGVVTAAGGMKGQPIERQREAFKTLSTRLISLADAIPPTHAVAGRLFVLHCPMAPGDWLQKTEGVANPYYADSMKQCGSVVRTISAREGKP